MARTGNNMMQATKLNSAKLYELSKNSKSLHHISQKVPGGSLMQGEFLYSEQLSGIWLHVCRILELQDAKCNFELSPGLSFTFMFEGEVEFSLAGADHHFKATNNKKEVMCSAICLSQDEIVSRKIRKGNKINKLNLSIERSYLDSRCQFSNDNADINKLFQNHGAIYQWIISDELKDLVLKLMDIINQENLLQRLHIESYTTEIMFHILSSLKDECAKTENLKNKKGNNLGDNLRPTTKKKQIDTKALKTKIDELIDQALDLNSIAKQLNMSVSTLQRKFRNAYGSTVIEYIRRKRLHIARNKMIAEGMSLNDAASFSGYKHPANFVTAFKKAFGTTPHAYCKELSY